MRVGFIGLGAIGTPMAVHIAGAFPTTVWNRTTTKSTAFAAAHDVTAASDVASLVRAVDVVITCLPVSADVAAVIDAAGDAWHADQLLVDCTSGDPAGSRANAATLAARGVGFVDAPVSGGTGGAEHGTLTVMLGGDEPWVGRAREVVTPFAGKVVHVGPVGCGHALKAVNNALLAINVVAVGEGLAALVRLGVPAAQAVEVINASSGRSNVTEHLVPERVLTGAWPRTFSLALLDKDVKVALAVLQDAHVPSTIYPVTQAALADARTRLDPGADHVEVIRDLEGRVGVTIRS